MTGRDPEEEHRQATTLELLYDLCFVVAIAFAAHGLHHAISHGEAMKGLLSFVMVFAAIWWAWMGFSWLASAFDPDDVPYRCWVLVQMTGLMVFAAGVPRAFEHQDWSIVVIGFAVMRLGLVAQWLRVARSSLEYRTTALRYAGGAGLLQIAWFLSAFYAPEQFVMWWVILIILELLVPVYAERAAPTPWHAEHISERYGLLTIIVIGESVLAAVTAVQESLEGLKYLQELMPIILGAPLIVFASWWLYFSKPAHEVLTSFNRAFFWGYLHYFVFGSIAATGAGIAVAADYATHSAHIPLLAAGLAVAVPVVVFLASLWFVLVFPRHERTSYTWAFVVTAIAVVVAAHYPGYVLSIGVLLATLTGVIVGLNARSVRVTH